MVTGYGSYMHIIEYWYFFKSRSSLAKYIYLLSDHVAEWLAVFFHGKSTALYELQFESVKRPVGAYNFILRGPRFEYRWK